MLSKEEKEQYSRHLLLDEIGFSGQQKLKKSKVLVIGAGGLGCPVLQYITAAGVGTIGIVDDDEVSPSNLQRQILYTYNDIGKKKAIIATKRLQALNPYITIEPYTERLTTNNALDLFREFDIIVDGSDNFSTRYLVNDAAVLTGKPVVFGAINQFEGQVSVYNYKGSATYRCLFPSAPNPEDAPNCETAGVLGVLPGIIGNLQANEVIKLITGIGSVLTNKLLILNTLNLSQVVLNYQKTTAANINKLQDYYEVYCSYNNTTELTYTEIINTPERYTLLDVRNSNERKVKHIGGLHIPLDDLTLRCKEIHTNKPIVVYCQSGIRSAKALTILKDLGVENKCFQLKGGLNAI